MDASINTSTDINPVDFSNPDRECDLVMKGGITSGIVYPRVVLKLASEGKYRFRSVGGTSAGAIAAAVTAAAEFGRETGGFNRFEELSQVLAEKGFLFKLFQPSPSLKPLMYTLLELLGRIKPDVGLEDSDLPPSSPPSQAQSKQQNRPVQAQSGIQSVLNSALRLVDILKRRHRSVALAGAQRGVLIGLGIALLLTGIASIVFYGVAAATNVELSFWAAIILFVVFAIPLGWIGYVGGILGFGANDLIQKLTQELPQNNFFGVCTGRRVNADPAVADPTVLTDWLSSEIDRIAGVDQPLTFGDLKNKKLADGQDVSIILKTVTSNLSQNQPYTMPFEEGNLFLFNEDEFRQLFPPNVVAYLKMHGGKQKTFTYSGKQQTLKLSDSSPYRFLPDANHLPIVVAMRMSLSFPLLISAVPLYTIKQSALEKQPEVLNDKHDLQKNWFSDGGISSNFPIHFFDSWLPSRPTFGINLTSVSPEALPVGSREISKDNFAVAQVPSKRRSVPVILQKTRENVYLPNVGDPVAPEWIDMKENLATFLWQIFSTSQNYRDTMQSYLPGYRERIVQIRLTETEGGLNLAMPESTINAVMQKGEDAGKLLQNFNFECHKWVRLRVLLGLLDDKLRETYNKALKDDKFKAKELINAAQSECFPFKYSSPEDTQKAKEAIERITQSAETLWSQNPSLNKDEDAPRPRSVLRTMPEF